LRERFPVQRFWSSILYSGSFVGGLHRQVEHALEQGV
jgi:hypothetical protein